MRFLAALFLFLFSSSVFGVDHTYNVVTVNGKKGLKDENGNFVISPKYDDIGWTNGENTPVDGVIGYQKDEKWGLINIRNQKLTLSKYANLQPFQGHTYIAAIKGKFSQRAFFGVVNDKGKSIIEFKYYSLKPINQHLIALSKYDHQFVYGLLDARGQVALKFKYKEIHQVSEHLLKAELSHNSFHLFNATKNQRIGEKYTAIKQYDDEHSLIQVDQLVGVLDHQGDVLVTPKFEAIKKDDRGKWLGKRLTNWAIINTDNQVIKEISCNSLTILDDYLLMKTTMGEELLGSKMNKVTPQPFDKIIHVSGNKVLYKNDNKYGIYDLGKQHLIESIKFDTAYISNQYIYAGRKYNNNMKWALYDTFGIKRTHFDYEVIEKYQDRLFAVKRKGYWGFMDRQGTEVVHCVYDEVSEFKEGLSVVRYHGLYGVINKKNSWVILPQEGKIKLVNEQLYLSDDESTTELRSIHGELIYFTDNSIKFENGRLIEILSSGEQRIISLSGVHLNNKKTTSGSYEYMKYLEDDMIAVKRNGRFGFVDKQYRLRITNRYEDVGHFHKKGIPIKLLGKWGMINTQEQIIVQPMYDSIYSPKNGISIITLQNLSGLMDVGGKVLISAKYDQITLLESGEYLVLIDKKYGLISSDGTQLVNAKYDELIRLDNNSVIVKKRGKYGTITHQGIEAIPNIYDKISYHKKWQLFFAKNEGEWESIIVP